MVSRIAEQEFVHEGLETKLPHSTVLMMSDTVKEALKQEHVANPSSMYTLDENKSPSIQSK
jgi:hypothetical protein